jgi:hypothetical protein
MTLEQQAALEALAGRALTQAEVEQITPLVAADVRNDSAVAAILSAGRTEVYSRMTSARGVAEFYPGGPIGAEIVLMKLEGARDAMLASADQEQQVFGSLLRRQLGFLAGEGLDFGSAALRGMLDQFAALGILTADEVAGLKAIAVRPAPLDVRAVTLALNGA